MDTNHVSVPAVAEHAGAAANMHRTTAMKKIKTLIVDDEPLARERLATLLSSEAGHRGRRASAATARRPSPRSRTTRRDLVFLDVQMPQMNGFEVIEAVGSERMPLVIFVTAYDQHALKAFQVRALDYLLKPFDRERFTDALQRARTPDRARRDRRPRPPAAGARQGPAPRSAAAPIAWSSSPAAACSSCARTRSTGSRRRATTSGCTSARRRTCCARR